MRNAVKLAAVFFSLLLNASVSRAAETVVVGSKAFTEGYLLGELSAQTLESLPNVEVNRKFGLGQTGVLFEALKNGDIDVYPEYTGTISEAILKHPEFTSFNDIQNALKPLHLVMSRPLGFNNTYAVAVTPEFAKTHSLKTISDLARVSTETRAGFSHEFMSRADGYTGLSERYHFHFKEAPQSMEHSLAYQAIENGSVDAIDVYTTDAKIEKLNLVVLTDDLHYFPNYYAVLLARQEFVNAKPKLWEKLRSLESSMNENMMRKMNAAVDIDRWSFQDTVAEFRRGPSASGGSSIASAAALSRRSDAVSLLLTRTKEHLFLVAVALFVSVVIGIPLGILALKNRTLGQAILLLSGTIQTIPSLALLCFLIPFFGIGVKSAIIALCLYGLLPVVMNTFIGLRSIDPALIEMTYALKLSRWQSLWRIRLPLASRTILAGIRTSAVIGIGTATLAALIGAGGYGAIIVSGLAINDTHLILMGAIPAAIMALVAHGLFEVIERIVIPKGLR